MCLLEVMYSIKGTSLGSLDHKHAKNQGPKPRDKKVIRFLSHFRKTYIVTYISDIRDIVA